jgi:hypothetical protein
MLSFFTHIFAVTVNGYAFLEGETDNSGIEVFFQRVIPDTLYTYSVSSDSTGFYSCQIEGGYYDVKYSKDGYREIIVEDAVLYSDQTLADQILTEIGNTLVGSIKGILHRGEYIVTDTLTVLEGDSLIIEPGVVMNFNPYAIFQINGYLKAEGTQTDSIIFRSLDHSGTGLICSQHPFSNARMLLNYCSIVNFEYSILVWNNYSVISNSYINASKQCIGYAGSVTEDSIELNNVLIEGANVGIQRTQTGIVSMLNCRILNCNYGYYIYMGGESFLELDNSFISAIHCFVSEISDYNIYIFNSTTISEDSWIYSPYGYGNLEVYNSIIESNGYTKSYSGTVSVINSSVRGITFPSIPHFGEIVTTNSNGDPCDPYGNIFLDPKFVDATNGDFRLQSDSPCIDAGTNTIAGYTFSISDLGNCIRIWDGDENGSSIVDIGAYEYGAPTDIWDISAVITDFELFQNFPNPFNPVTSISYALSKTGQVELQVYNLNGQLVKELVSSKQVKGVYKAEFNGADLTSGMYIYNLKVDNKVVSSKKMMLLK